MEKLNELAAEIVENLVACDSAEPEAVEQYQAWTLKRLAEAFRVLERTSDTNMAAAQAMRDDMYHWKKRAEAAKAKLAELAKQPPVGNFYDDGPGNWWQIGPHDKVPHVTPLFTRPAPAADLAELVPDNDLLRVLDFAKFVIKCVRKNGEYAPLSSQEPDEIDAILRNIEQKHGSAN